jgi:hypothetical protein
MKTLRIVFSLVALLLAGLAQAQQKPCSKADAAGADKAIERVVSWGQLQKAWQDYKHCDAGPIDEQFTDALLRLLVDWKDMPSFAAAFEKDAQYKEFILRHLNSPAAKDDLESIYSRSKASCPAKLDKFCAEMAEVARPGSPSKAAPEPAPTPAPPPAPAPNPAPTAK